MWFNSIYLRTLRDFRIAILGWGLGMGLLMFAVLIAVPSLINTPEARTSLVILARAYSRPRINLGKTYSKGLVSRNSARKTTLRLLIGLSIFFCYEFSDFILRPDSPKSHSLAS